MRYARVRIYSRRVDGIGAHSTMSVFRKQVFFANRAHSLWVFCDDNKVPQTAFLDPKIRKTGYVYLATNPDLIWRDLYKIGSTTNLDEMQRQLDDASFDEFVFLYVYETTDYKRLTEYLHLVLADMHEKRGFFSLEPEYIDGFIDICNDFVKYK